LYRHQTLLLYHWIPAFAGIQPKVFKRASLQFEDVYPIMDSSVNNKDGMRRPVAPSPHRSQRIAMKGRFVGITEPLVPIGMKIRFEDLPKEDIEKTRLVLLDSIGCALASHVVDRNKLVIEFTNEFGAASRLLKLWV
jgi:hypothetical protein